MSEIKVENYDIMNEKTWLFTRSETDWIYVDDELKIKIIKDTRLFPTCSGDQKHCIHISYKNQEWDEKEISVGDSKPLKDNNYFIYFSDDGYIFVYDLDKRTHLDSCKGCYYYQAVIWNNKLYYEEKDFNLSSEIVEVNYITGETKSIIKYEDNGNSITFFGISDNNIIYCKDDNVIIRNIDTTIEYKLKYNSEYCYESGVKLIGDLLFYPKVSGMVCYNIITKESQIITDETFKDAMKLCYVKEFDIYIFLSIHRDKLLIVDNNFQTINNINLEKSSSYLILMYKIIENNLIINNNYSINLDNFQLPCK